MKLYKIRQWDEVYENNRSRTVESRPPEKPTQTGAPAGRAARRALKSAMSDPESVILPLQGSEWAPGEPRNRDP